MQAGATTPSLGGPEVVIRLDGITKRFPGVVANDSVSLEIRRGEVHCLLGENGAGKSTLMGILAGLQQPDSGRIEVDGSEAVLASPADAIARGIGAVAQHSTLIPNLTVLENLMLGDTRKFWLDRRAAAARWRELSEQLGLDIDASRPAGSLGLGQQQQVEIAKALWAGSRLLMLDEPTSRLSPEAADRLMERIDKMRADGLAVLFVTHKLHEALAVGDTVTVLREGRVADRIGPAEMQSLPEPELRARILAGMFGSVPATLSGEERDAAGVVGTTGIPAATESARPPVVARDAPVVLRVEALSTRSDSGETPISGIDCEIRSGEILGIAGIEGHGQGRLAEAIAGQRAAASGRLSVDGIDVTSRTVKQRQRIGVRYVTDDRLGEGIVGSLSVALNLVLKRIGESPFWGRFGRMDRAAVRAEARAQIAAYDIHPASEQVRAGTLSGGNIQKILLARELSHEPRVVVFRNPTSGLDLKTVAHVHDAIRDFAGAGGAALLISTDLDELVQLSHRIAVLSGGRVVGEVAGDGDRVAERVGALMADAGETR